MIAKLELYAVILLGMVLAGTGAYFKGRYDQHSKEKQADLAASAQVLADELTRSRERAEADAKARDAALAFVARMNKGLSDVNAKFASLPNVVLDARGCPDLSGNFRLRWDAVAGAATPNPAGRGTAGPVSGGAAVPTP